MNQALKKLMSGAVDASALAKELAESGMKSVNGIIRDTRIFGALTASTSEQSECDETHYVLVPLLGGEKRYAIYSKRILPSGVGATNSLPKARIFHVPDESGRGILEQELIEQKVRTKLDGHVASSDIADALEKIADQIDRETNKVSGGLILIGGAVALVNPLLGIGIAAKALLPSVGSKVSKAGAELVGNKLRDWNKSSEKGKAEKVAVSEVKKLKPQVFTNPIIRSLEAVATDPATDYDPSYDDENWADSFEKPHYYSLTCEAVGEVFRAHDVDLSTYRRAHTQWLESLMEGP